MTDRDSVSASPAEGAELTSRWLRPLGIATVTVIVALSLRERPSPAVHGGGLAVTAALLVLVASIVAMRWRPGDRLVLTLAPVALIVASSTLVWTQSGGPAIAGLFVAVSYAALRLALSRSLGMLVLAALTLAASAVHSHRSTGLIVSAELGVIAFYLLASFARRVQEAHEQTSRLLAELEATRRLGEEAAALRERSRIAREIHDVLAHSLAGLMLQLEGARMLARAPNPNGQLLAALDRAHHLARAGLEEARRAVGALRDEDLPGPDRLEQLAADFTRDSRIDAKLEISGAPHQLDSQRSLTLFRVAQEALTNSLKHSHPQRIELRLAYQPDGTRLVIEDYGERDPAPTIAKNGLGQCEDGIVEGYGLTGMRERAELLGGRLHAAPTSDGFKVELWIPA